MRRPDDCEISELGLEERTDWDEQEAAEFGFYSFDPDAETVDDEVDPDDDAGGEPEWS